MDMNYNMNGTHIRESLHEKYERVTRERNIQLLNFLGKDPSNPQSRPNAPTLLPEYIIVITDDNMEHRVHRTIYGMSQMLYDRIAAWRMVDMGCRIHLDNINGKKFCDIVEFIETYWPNPIERRYVNITNIYNDDEYYGPLDRVKCIMGGIQENYKRGIYYNWENDMSADIFKPGPIKELLKFNIKEIFEMSKNAEYLSIKPVYAMIEEHIRELVKHMGSKELANLCGIVI